MRCLIPLLAVVLALAGAYTGSKTRTWPRSPRWFRQSPSRIVTVREEA